MSDRGSIDQWRRDSNNHPTLYDTDVASREFRGGPDGAPRPRRKSILVDPQDRARRPPAARRNSQVRLQSSDDEQGGFVPVRRPPIGSEASRVDREMASRHDVERKTQPEHRRFREKRDGYESDEGETLRRGAPADDPRPRRSQKQPRDYDDDGYGYGGGGGRDRDRDRQRRPDPRTLDPRDIEPREMPVRTRAPPVQYGDAPLNGKGRGGGDYGDGAMRRANSYRDPGRRPRQAYDDDDDDYRAPPRRHASQRQPQRRGYDPRMDDYDDYDRRDAGYRSDRDGRRQRGPRYDDYYSDGDHARGYNRPPTYYDDDRRYGRRDSYKGSGGYGRERSRGRDDRYRDDDRQKNKNLQKTAQAAFVSYAMPMIKKEGGRLVYGPFG